MAASPVNPQKPDLEQNATSLSHPSTSEEFDSLRYRMPPALPMIGAMLLVVVVVGILAYVFRAKPVAAGTISDAAAVTLPALNASLAIVNLDFQNLTKEPLRLINVNVAVHAKGADFNSDFGSVADFPRYLQAFPTLAQHAKPGLVRDSRIRPQEHAVGSVMVALPLTQEEFDARDSMTVTLTFDGGAKTTIVSGKKP